MGVVVCAWCGEVLRYEPSLDDHEVSHGICESCKRDLQKELEQMKGGDR